MNRTQYCYFVCGHIRVNHSGATQLGQAYTAPYDTVVRLAKPITDEGGLVRLAHVLTNQIAAELKRTAGQDAEIDGEPMVRQVSLLHTVLVDKDGQVAKVLS